MQEIRIQKNDEYIIDITDIGVNGEGIGRIMGYALFVKDSVPGDRIRVKVIKTKKGFGYGRLIEILEPSKDRIEPKCKVARQCGGCQLQHLSYKKQLEYKQNKVQNCLERIGGCKDFIMEPILGMEEPYYYRNKAQFPVGETKHGELAIGFYAMHTHSIIDNKDCCIQLEINEVVMNIVRKFLEEYHIEPYHEKTHTGLVRHILIRAGLATGEIMVCLVINGNKLPYEQKLIEILTRNDLNKKGKKGFWKIASISLNINKEKTNVIMGQKCVYLWGQKYITDKIGENRYQVSPLSFYQVNSIQTEKLYNTALEFAELTGTETVWDLYCGTGTISLFLARRAKKVYGVEIVPQAVEDAKENAKINGIKNAEFFCGAAEIILPEWYKKYSLEEIDVVLVDPPRKGCDRELLKTITEMNPKRIVYVSCDPATLARDVKVLENDGYVVKKVRACDMFGNCVNIEAIVLIQRKES